MAGYIHLYYGEGKCKTTAAVGLAVRAAGAGQKVVFTQFLKDGSSSEITVLQNLANVCVLHGSAPQGFWWNLNDDQKAQACRCYAKLFADATAAAATADLLVLDEIVAACNHGAVAEKDLLAFLRGKPQQLEVVLTGRAPSPALVQLADYVTEMQKVKHPFDHGVAARRGIEF